MRTRVEVRVGEQLERIGLVQFATNLVAISIQEISKKAKKEIERRFESVQRASRYEMIRERIDEIVETYYTSRLEKLPPILQGKIDETARGSSESDMRVLVADAAREVAR